MQNSLNSPARVIKPLPYNWSEDMAKAEAEWNERGGVKFVPMIEDWSNFGDWRWCRKEVRTYIGPGEAVKVIRREEKNDKGVPLPKWYFIKTHEIPFHFDFARLLLGEKRPLAQFNREVYTGKDHSMFCATLVRYVKDTNGVKSDYFTLELNAVDPLDDEQFETLKKALGELNSTKGMKTRKVGFRFRPTSDMQATVVEEKKKKGQIIPLVTTAEMFGEAINTQSYVNGNAMGIMRYISRYISADDDMEAELAKVGRYDVVFCERIPNDLPVCAAVFTAHHSAMFHSYVRTERRLAHLPLVIAYQKKAKEANGKVVEARIYDSGAYFVEPLDYLVKREFEKLRLEIETKPTIGQVQIAPPNKKEFDLVEIAGDKDLSIAVVGAKAKGCHSIERLLNQASMKSSFVIPMAHYLKAAQISSYLKSINEIYTASEKTIKAAIDEKSFEKLAKAIMSPNAQVTKTLETMRSYFSNDAFIPSELIESVCTKLRQGGVNQAIFRSSTNAEDLPGFVGAGLYDSIVVNDTANQTEVETAIRKVWASTWTQRGFFERQHYKIDSSQVGMAILVQPYLGSQSLANGVALTLNRLQLEKPGCILVSSLKGSSQLVTAQNSSGSEELLVFLSRSVGEVDVELITRSAAGAVLHRGDIIQLVDALKTLQVFLLGKDLVTVPASTDGNALDVEFVVVGSFEGARNVVILQARPFHVDVTK